jgi:acyl carrier protein
MERSPDQDVETEVREALLKHSRLRLKVIRDGDRLAGDLGCDSFAMLNAVLDLEERFDVEVEPAKLAGFRDMTFRELVTVLEDQLVASTGASPPEGPQS